MGSGCGLRLVHEPALVVEELPPQRWHKVYFEWRREGEWGEYVQRALPAPSASATGNVVPTIQAIGVTVSPPK
jgi:hypothetical protein